MNDSARHDRTAFIGGSDAAAILGISPWKSAFRLYLEKIGEFSEEVSPAKQKLFNRGHRWEPVVVDMLLDELSDRGHDARVLGRNERYHDQEFQFLACELDLELLVDGEETNAEIKTVSPFSARGWGEQGTDDIPLHYAAQAMHGLMIKPRRRAIVAALIGADDLRIHFIDRDDDTIAGMRRREIEFWQRIQDRNPPDPQTAEDVRWLYAKDCGEIAEADNELLALVGDLNFQKIAAKRAEAAIERISTQIKLAMGNAALLMYEGRPVATWKSNKPSRKTDWQAVAGELNAPQELIERHTRVVAGNRPLILK